MIRVTDRPFQRSATAALTQRPTNATREMPHLPGRVGHRFPVPSWCRRGDLCGISAAPESSRRRRECRGDLLDTTRCGMAAVQKRGRGPRVKCRSTVSCRVRFGIQDILRRRAKGGRQGGHRWEMRDRRWVAHRKRCRRTT